ncbi:MAG: UTP--glucose-1-phosphate uridylyltransferase [Phycisphaeraceae bacterium]
MPIQSVTTAVIPAAGFGTRLLPATKAVPKEMLAVLDKPVLQYVIEEALDSGITHLVIVINDGKEAIRKHLADDPALEAFLKKTGKADRLALVHDVARGAKITFVNQPEQKGLGDAVRCARAAVGDQPFAVMLGDTIIAADDGQPAGLRQLIDVHEQTPGSVTGSAPGSVPGSVPGSASGSASASVVGVRRVPREKLSKYGIVDGRVEGDDERTLRLHRLVEKPRPDEAPTDLAIAGRYVFTPAIFDWLEHATAGVGGEIQLTDAMNELAAREPMYAHRWRATRYDIGDRLEHLQCCIALALKDAALGPALRQYLAEQR